MTANRFRSRNLRVRAWGLEELHPVGDPVTCAHCLHQAAPRRAAREDVQLVLDLDLG